MKLVLKLEVSWDWHRVQPDAWAILEWSLYQHQVHEERSLLQPIDRYGLDAAILFSDILTVPDAMGLGLSFVAGEGPVFAHPVQSEEAVNALHVPDVGTDLKYVTDAVSSIRRALNNWVPLIGFSGSPFTLACYMVEGRGSRDFRLVKQMMYQRPDHSDQSAEG